MKIQTDPHKLAQRFQSIFGGVPRIFVAPGRINIIGEHVDYCGGLVMPAAIDRACYVASAPNGLDILRIETEFGAAEIGLDQFQKRGDWRDYVAGMAFALRDAGFEILGHDLLIQSDVPVGAGVSSSAALEVAVGLALTRGVAQGPHLAQIAQRAENHYVGMACGIMDQFASAVGGDGGAIMLDCATLAFVPLTVDPRASFILVDSGIKHALVSGEYASRRADCEAAALELGVAQLAQITDLCALSGLSGNRLKRARHVVSEIKRTQDARLALGIGDLSALGHLMNQSHESLSVDMEVSTPQIDQLAAIAQSTPHVYGARMMGGGFGGSVIVLVDAKHAQDAQALIENAYAPLLGRMPDAFVAKLASGAGEFLLRD